MKYGIDMIGDFLEKPRVPPFKTGGVEFCPNGKPFSLRISSQELTLVLSVEGRNTLRGGDIQLFLTMDTPEQQTPASKSSGYLGKDVLICPLLERYPLEKNMEELRKHILIQAQISLDQPEPGKADKLPSLPTTIVVPQLPE